MTMADNGKKGKPRFPRDRSDCRALSDHSAVLLTIAETALVHWLLAAQAQG
jgi:hypothetical protein